MEDRGGQGHRGERSLLLLLLLLLLRWWWLRHRQRLLLVYVMFLLWPQLKGTRMLPLYSLEALLGLLLGRC